MADPKWREVELINEKLTAYLETHHKIVGDFERSLGNASHCIELAKLAKDQEPENAVTMLEQIKEIDLLGHVHTQFEAFQEFAGLMPEPSPDEDAQEESGGIERLRERYELLLEEAELQQEVMEDLVLYLHKQA